VVAPRTPLARRISRLAATGSPRAIARAVRREVGLRRAGRRLEDELRAGGPVLVGPFAGEVGYELLYWLPFVRRFLRQHSVDPERVTVMTRGGAGAWYRDVAAHELDVLDVVSPDGLRERVAERERARGDRKQLVPDAFDRELVAAAEERLGGPAALLHPRFMYARSRFVWEGLEPPSRALELGDYDPLPVIDSPLPDPVAALEPGSFVAVKAYFNDCLPDSAAARAAVSGLFSQIAERHPVVLLSTALALDDHGEWRGGQAVIDLTSVEARSNLAVQTTVVSRARALVSTYGGFSYLGPYLGIPTVALAAVDEPNRNHDAVLRNVFTDAAYERVAPTEAEGALARLVPESAIR
jgi:hypothetical protein